jgi:hypothetical protein
LLPPLPSLQAQQPASIQDPEDVNSGLVVPAHPAATPHVEFVFQRPGLPVPVYLLSIYDDAELDIYQGQEVAEPTPGSTIQPKPHPFMRSFNLSAATRARIFKLARDLNYFNIACASKAKNIADTGTKTLSYSAPDAHGSCTYNYSENKDVQALTELLQGITETMDEGRKLDYLHRYDRLGLDAEIAYLAQEVTAGRALELGTIAESLRAIAADAEVMQRVRTRANSLLARLPDGSAQAVPAQN